mgnify:CR=1 FL=1
MRMTEASPLSTCNGKTSANRRPMFMDTNTIIPDMHAISANEKQEKRTPPIPYVMPTLKLSMLTLKASKIMDTHNHICPPCRTICNSVRRGDFLAIRHASISGEMFPLFSTLFRQMIRQCRNDHIFFHDQEKAQDDGGLVMQKCMPPFFHDKLRQEHCHRRAVCFFFRFRDVF